MKHNFLILVFLLLSAISISSDLHAQYFSEPFETMTDVGSPSDSLVAPPGWTAERVTAGITGPIATPPRVTHRTSPLSPPARISGDGARDFELATRVSTGEWVVTRPSSNNFYINDTVQTNGTKPPASFTPVGTTALWFNDWFCAGSGTGGRNVRRIYSPAFDLSSSTSPRVKFKYFYASGSFQLRILASSDNGTTWNVIGSASATGTANWRFTGARIPDAYKVSNARIGLEAVNAWGSHDAWIDSLVVEESTTILSNTSVVGNWSDPAVWNGGVVPQVGDNVIILPNSKITIDVPVNVHDLFIQDTLRFDNITTNTLTVTGDLRITSGGRLNLFNGTSGRTLSLSRNFTLDGTADFSKNGSAFLLNGNLAQSISGSGSFDGGVVRLLAVDNPNGVTISPTFPLFNISSTLNLARGTLNTNGRLSIDNTNNNSVPTTSCGVQRGIGSITGGLTVGPTATYNLTYTLFSGTSPSFITSGDEIPPSRSVNNFTYQLNTAGVFISGGPLTVRNQFTMGTNASTLFLLDTLTLGTSPTSPGTLIAGTTGRINGAFSRWIGTTIGSRDFPVGINERRNLSVNFTVAPTTGGRLTARFVPTDPGNSGLPLTDGPLNLVNLAPDGYWTLDLSDGLAGGTATVSATATNFGGVSNIAGLRLVHRPDNSSPWGLIGNAGTNTGTPAAPVVVRTGISLPMTSQFGIAGDATNQLPVELTAFEGTFKNGEVHLSWRTASEQNNSGFEVERSVDRETFTKIGFVRGAGSTTEAQSYTFVDRGNFTGETVYYRLKQVDFDGRFEYSPVIEVAVLLPTKFALMQNYPNPFNPSTTIAYELPTRAKVLLKVYDMLGREVATLVNGEQTAGRYAQPFNASQFSSGVYFYRLQAGNFVETKKMILVK